MPRKSHRFSLCLFGAHQGAALHFTASLRLSLLAVVLLVPSLGTAAVNFDPAIAPAAFAAGDIQAALTATGQTAGTIDLQLDAALGAQAYVISGSGQRFVDP